MLSRPRGALSAARRPIPDISDVAGKHCEHVASVFASRDSVMVVPYGGVGLKVLSRLTLRCLSVSVEEEQDFALLEAQRRRLV